MSGIIPQINLTAIDPDIPNGPKFAITNDYIFWTFKERGNLVLRWAKLDQTGAITGGISAKIQLNAIANMLDLRIFCERNVALVVAIESVGSSNTVKAAVGKVSGAPPVFNHILCQDRVLPAGQILGILGRIYANDESDDLVVITGAGATTGAYGHHPHL